jgi:putative adenylate-forming enzyme
MLRLLSTLAHLRRRDHWVRPQLEAYQAESLQVLRQFVYNRSPFYQQFHKGLDHCPLQDLPVLTKAIMMEHFDDLVTDRSIHLEDVRAYAAGEQAEKRFLNRYWVSATSGSSGHPGLFLFNESEWLAVLASFARAHEWAGVEVSLTHRMKMASVASVSPRHMSAQVGATLKSWWMPALRLAASEPLSDIVQCLNNWQPDMLVAYASMARILADEQSAGRLSIHSELVYTSSEVLTDETRRRIEAAWGHPPFNQYAATETGGLAAECTHHRGMHLMEDLVIVEVVDEFNRPVAPGQCGDKALVTVLSSRTQPLIRYELRDSLRLATEMCPCGRPFALVESIQGRVEDVLLLPASTGGWVRIQPLVFHRIMDMLPVSGWQVIQEDDDGLTVLVSGIGDHIDEQTLVDELAQVLKTQGVQIPRVRLQHVVTIPKTAAGKAPLIKAKRSAANETDSVFEPTLPLT